MMFRETTATNRAVTARDIMRVGADFVWQDDPVTQAAWLVRDRALEVVPVCDGYGRWQGVVTAQDVRCRADRPDVAAGELAHDEGCCVDFHADVREIRDAMARHHTGQLPVVAGDWVIGTITKEDLPMVRSTPLVWSSLWLAVGHHAPVRRGLARA
jgi:predicted transcriptional regulator